MWALRAHARLKGFALKNPAGVCPINGVQRGLCPLGGAGHAVPTFYLWVPKGGALSLGLGDRRSPKYNYTPSPLGRVGVG